MRFPYSNAKSEPGGSRSSALSPPPCGRTVISDRSRHHAKSEVVDVFLVRYIDWREACDDLRATDARWRAADRLGTAFAFLAYGAALEREEAAAMAYSRAAAAIRSYDDYIVGPW